jgi:hypothetical protein
MSEWQKIETAPKDGTIILAYCPNHFYNGGAFIGEAVFIPEFSIWEERIDGCVVEPTHWMPLPNPPKEET